MKKRNPRVAFFLYINLYLCPLKNQLSLPEKTQNNLKFFNKTRIYIAIFIGLSISGYLLYNEIKSSGIEDVIEQVHWSFQSTLFILLAITMMMLRDFAYMIRLRVITEKQLSWRQALKVILMWEFASTVSPGVVGGSAVAMFILNKEKIPLGKSTALVITTALFDNIFYLLYIPIILFFIGSQDLIPENIEAIGLNLFWMGYGIIFTIASILSISLFLYPQLIKKILLFIFKLPFLKRLIYKVNKFTDDIIIASKELKGKPFLFWIKIFMSTTLSWTARFLVVNFILMAFVHLNFTQNVIVLGRQLVMWLFLLVSPTPGGSGLAEYIFNTFLGDFLQVSALAIVLAIIWRLISYYPYSIIGLLILPKWLRGDAKQK